MRRGPASVLVTVDHGLRRIRRYRPGEQPVTDEIRWRGTGLATLTMDGVEHVFSDGPDLLADVRRLSRDAAEAARRVLGHPPDSGASSPADGPAPDDGLAGEGAALAERYGVRLVHAEYRQRVAVGPPTWLTRDERRLATVEIVDDADPAWAEVVVLVPGDAAGNRERLEEAADQVRRTSSLPRAELTATGCDVVLDPGAAGPLFHELVGHPLEADVSAGGATWLADREGEQVAPSWLAVTDGPAPLGEGLAAAVDDEGTPVVTTPLIDRGRVAGPLRDRLTALEAGGPGGTHEDVTAVGGAPAVGPGSTGHGRRLDYRHLVAPRMWHTRAHVVGDPPLQEPPSAARLHPRGLQLAWLNPLTGEVEFRCADGVLDDGEGQPRRIGPFLLAGTGGELLAALRPGAGTVRGSGRARPWCAKLGQFPLVTTYANAAMWIPGEAVHVRDDHGW
ncbi:MAG TPA: metallopeptidase TldD-related protein [Kineosporiaceae bacterium]